MPKPCLPAGRNVFRRHSAAQKIELFMKHSKGILIFGVIEIAIGAITLIAVLISLVLKISTKPPNILIFVITASLISLGLGVGIIRRNVHAYHMLLFFASVVILSKILIFAKIITLSGSLETIIASPIKDTFSLIYHIHILLYFNFKKVKQEFIDQNKTGI